MLLKTGLGVTQVLKKSFSFVRRPPPKNSKNGKKPAKNSKKPAKNVAFSH
jgi:hypothetical protein